MALSEAPAGEELARTALEARAARIPFGPQLWLVPVRHHSPACARHLRQLIRQVRPQRILIEGPADATHLITHLGAKDARAPLALYCFRTGTAVGDAEPERTRAFYPLADFSPEWVAIREGLSIGAELGFIDLPFADRRLQEPDEDLPANAERALNEDRLLQHSWAAGQMTTRSGCRDFNEWWDRYFESRFTGSEPGEFFRNLLLWCLLLRPEDDAGDAETRAREQAMAAAVCAAQEGAERCLVVTGGYHCEGIARWLESAPVPGDAGPAPTKSAAAEQGVYLIPYSLTRLDEANGYAAGIADCGYYQQLWQHRSRPAPHAETIRACAARVAGGLRSEGELVTLPDVLEASLLAERLGALRDCPPGRPELFDAMESAFAKDLQPDAQLWRRRLRTFVVRERVGKVPGGYPASPLVEDFREQCRRFRLPIGAEPERVRRLDLYRSERHRRISHFLQQLRFLDVPYAAHESGPDFAAGVGLDRVREEWRVCWHPESEAALTERGEYGARVREAAAALLAEHLGRGRDVPALLVAALQMGLRELIGRLLDRLSLWVGQEGDVVCLAAGLSRIELARTSRYLLEAQDVPALEALLSTGLEYACRRLSWLGTLEPERDAACADALDLLHALARTDLPGDRAELFAQALRGLAEHAPAPILAGRAAGILLARGVWSPERAREAVEQAMRQAELTPEWLGGFLQGFLPPARALLLQEPELLRAMSRILLRWDETQWLALLPHLRLAFTTLKPRESAELAELLVRLFSDTEQVAPSPWSDGDRAVARDLYQQTRALLKRWGMVDGD